MKYILVGLAGLATFGLFSAACGGSSSSSTTSTSTTPSVIVGPTTQFFEGTLTVQGSSFYSFMQSNTNDVSLTLASLTTDRYTVAPVFVGLGLGTPLGTGCVLSHQVPATPGLTAQLTATVTPGIYCAAIADIGQLSHQLSFMIRIVHH